MLSGRLWCKIFFTQHVMKVFFSISAFHNTVHFLIISPTFNNWIVDSCTFSLSFSINHSLYFSTLVFWLSLFCENNSKVMNVDDSWLCVYFLQGQKFHVNSFKFIRLICCLIFFNEENYMRLRLVRKEKIFLRWFLFGKENPTKK